MSERAGFLAAGNWIIDYTKTIDVWPAQDALANILEETFANGGGPFNLLVDLAKLGASFPLAGAGLIGDDATGELVLEICSRHGICTEQLHRTPDVPTSYTDVMTVRSTGRRTFFHQRGTNAHFGPEHLDFRHPSVASAKIFYLGYLLLLDRFDAPGKTLATVAAETLRDASLAGCLTAVDVVSEDSDRFSSLVPPALPWTDFAILNELEAARTTGHSTRTEAGTLHMEGVVAAARHIRESGVRRWVIVHFPEGTVALSCAEPGASPVFQRSLRVPPDVVAGSSGAGDAFAAGLLLGLHDGQPIETALRYAVCAAGASLMHPTTSDGVLALEDCLALEERWGFQS